LARRGFRRGATAEIQSSLRDETRRIESVAAINREAMAELSPATSLPPGGQILD
jgi:hypothetical protein